VSGVVSERLPLIKSSEPEPAFIVRAMITAPSVETEGVSVIVSAMIRSAGDPEGLSDAVSMVRLPRLDPFLMMRV
jgi:hypothetical protein